MPRDRSNRSMFNEDFKSSKNNTTPANSRAAGSISSILEKNMERESTASKTLDNSNYYLTRKVSRETGRQNLGSLKRIFDKNPSTMEAQRHKLVLRSVKSTFQKMSDMELYETASIYGLDYEDFPKGKKGKEELVEALVGEYLVRMPSSEKVALYKKVMTAEKEIENQTKQLNNRISKIASGAMSNSKMRKTKKVTFRKSLSLEKKMDKKGLEAQYTLTYSKRFSPYYKELFRYLKTIPEMNLRTLGYALELSFNDKEKLNTMRRRIAETVMVYADIVSQRHKKGYNVQRSDDFKRVARDLIDRTSLNYTPIDGYYDIIIDKSNLKLVQSEVLKDAKSSSGSGSTSPRRSIQSASARLKPNKINKDLAKSRKKTSAGLGPRGKRVGLSSLGIGAAGLGTLGATSLASMGLMKLFGAGASGMGVSSTILQSLAGLGMGLGGIGALGLGGLGIAGLTKKRRQSKLMKSDEFRKVKEEEGYLKDLKPLKVLELAEELGIKYKKHWSIVQKEKIKENSLKVEEIS